MGTNYYHTPHEPCEKCKRPYEPRHIGKSSGGWTFALHIYPDDEINSLDDWIERFKTGKIHDEYGQEISRADMVSTIALRKRDRPAPTGEWLAQNHAAPGPHNLARAQIDGAHCIGYGEGTWDYFVGEFS